MAKEVALTYTWLRRALPQSAQRAREALSPYRRLAWHLAALAAAFLATRCLFLTRIPIFCDEAIYLDWAQMVADSRKWRFISYTDGKPPLHSWLLGAATLRFDDPLVAGRAVSVLSGALAVAGVIAAAWVLLRSRRAALAAGWLYVLSPFCLFHDRLALPDPLVAAIGAWALLLSVLMARRKTLSPALLLGLVVGIGMLAKQPAVIFLLLAPVALRDDVDRSPAALARWAGLFVVAYLLMRTATAVHFLAPKMGMLMWKQYQYAAAPSEWRTALTEYLPQNVIPTLDAFLRYLTPGPFLLGVIGLARARGRPPLAVAGAWALLPIAAVVVVSRLVPFPRYLLVGVPAFLILAAGAGDALWDGLAVSRRRLILAACLVPLVAFDALILIRPEIAPLPHADRVQYLEDWPAGYGVREIVARIRADAHSGPVDVVTPEGLGVLPNAIRIYFHKRRDVRVAGIGQYDPAARRIRSEPRERKPHRVYVVLDSIHARPEGWLLHEIAHYPRPGGRSGLALYEIAVPAALRERR